MENTRHLVHLTNGETLLIEECENAISISSMDGSDVDMYICRIDANGVLVYPNSGSATECLSGGLRGHG